MRPAAILLLEGAATIPRLLGHGLVRLVWDPIGGPSLVHSDRMWSAVCSGAPHRQAAEGLRPQRYMLAPKRPTPVRRRFKVTHSLRGRSAPGGMFVPGRMVNCAGFVVSCQSCFQCSIRLKLDVARDFAWRLKGRRERRRWRPRFWAVVMRACKRLEVSRRALLTSVAVWCSLRSAGGAIPERTGRYFTGVGRRHPLTILMVSLRVTSSFFTWVLLHHAGAAYSAAL